MASWMSLPERVSLILETLEHVDRRLGRLINTVANMEINMSAAMDRLTADVAAERTVIASAVTLLEGLSQQLKDALASGDTAALEQIATDLETQTQSLAAAVTANTPAPKTDPNAIP